MIRLIFFDFDGTLLESADIKTNAFRKLFSWSERVDEIVEYHRANAGVNRYEKFDYIYREILRQPLEKSKKEELGKKFSEIVLDELLKCPLVKGASEFLKKYHSKKKMFIVSSSPHEDLEYIVKQRGLSPLFAGVFGAPATKSRTILRIMREDGASPNEVLVVGDSTADMNEAKKAGVLFVGRLFDPKSGDFPDGTRVIRDLTELEAAMEGFS